MVRPHPSVDGLMPSAPAAVASHHRQPLGFILLTLLSASGGLILLTIHSLVSIAK